MNFYRETGAIITPNKQILHLVDGTAGLTLFPDTLAWNLHKSSPGNLFAFSHVHPPGMENLSHEDETTLKAWTMALYPHPMRMITITEYSRGLYEIYFKETCYFGMIESKEAWQMRSSLRSDEKKHTRKFEIIKDYVYKRSVGDDFNKEEKYWYGQVLVERSYK